MAIEIDWIRLGAVYHSAGLPHARALGVVSAALARTE